MFEKIKATFMKHPNEVGESYFGHMLFALTCAAKFGLLFFICIIHSIFPFLFTRTAGQWVREMSGDISSKYEK